jgi:(5-formylfuran-3-yl)methyl phosphate synthase
MQLLVSVRSAEEVGPALAGGADIIDAKEPNNGSLGRVSAETLVRIAAELPPERNLSVALGDVSSTAEVDEAFQIVRRFHRTKPIYLKLGFAGVVARYQIQQLIYYALGQVGSGYRIIPVAYADAARAQTVAPDVLLELVRDTPVSGMLLDTYRKDGTDLFAWSELEALAQWVRRVQQRGLLAAVAGSLDTHQFGQLWNVRPDIVGVRGAACEGGRQGRISAERVTALRHLLQEEPGVPGGSISYSS